MGEPLFDLACRLGWLNLVDRDANTDEAVYAFFHTTFQEYFAACAIDDWRYFLNHNNETPNPFEQYNGKNCVYRIFAPQWKEVFLLWMDQEKVTNEQKNKLLWALVEFKDGCNDLRIDPPWKILVLKFLEREKVTKALKDELLQALVEFNESCNDLCIYWQQAYDLAYEGICHDNIHHDELELGKILYIDEEGATSTIDVVIPEYKKLYLGFPSWNERVDTSPKDIYRTIACLWGEGTLNILKEINHLNHPLPINSTNLNTQTGAENMSLVNQRDAMLLKTIVSAFKACLKSDPHEYPFYHSILWICAQNMPYPDFYEAWHHTSIHQRR